MRTLSTVAVVAAAGLAIVVAATDKKVNLPAPFATPSSNNRPQVIDRPNGAQLRLPAGFGIEEWATGFEKPRFMLAGPSGEILLSDSVENGSVYVLTKNGKEKKKILTGLGRPYGLALWKNYLYVAEATSLKRYPYDAKAMTAGAGSEVVSMKDYGKGHWTRTVLFDPKGTKMYLTIGSGSNVDAGEPKDRAAINRFNPDGSGHEIFASGLRNVIGLRWLPGTTRLFAATQERDLLGDDLVPDYFTEVKQGAFYGWPFAYIGPNEDPRRKGEAPELVKKTVTPDVPLGAHVAVLDFIFYTGKQFPAKYQGGVLLAQHGSWNRSQRVGYNVVYLPFQNGKPTGQVEEFLTGWMMDPSKREVWGRPVGLLQMSDGSILITDDGGNKIWRVFYKG
jgi:glucose/arabinose dehydrogenase